MRVPIASSIDNSFVTGGPLVLSTTSAVFWYASEFAGVEDFLSELSILAYSPPPLWIAIMARENNGISLSRSI
jgi:hypothetical protein